MDTAQQRKRNGQSLKRKKSKKDCTGLSPGWSGPAVCYNVTLAGRHPIALIALLFLSTVLRFFLLLYFSFLFFSKIYKKERKKEQQQPRVLLFGPRARG